MAHLHYQDAPHYIYKISKRAQLELPFASGLKPGQIVANQFIELECIDDESVLLSIKTGYAWDGNSAGAKTESWIVPSLAHDCFYQLMREGLLDRSLRKEADKCMYYLLKKSMIRGNFFSRKIGATRARLSYLAVRQFGGQYVKAVKVKAKKVKIH